MTDMHARSAALRNVSVSEPATRGTARKHLVFLLTKDDAGNYPWQYAFAHDSYPDRVWGPYASFNSFLGNIQPDGTVGPGGPWSRMTVQDFREWFAKDTVICDLIDKAMQRTPGGDRSKIDNVQLDPSPTGNTKDAGLRRLRKDRPDLHSQVLEGELTVHAAMVEAGFRQKMLQVPAEDLDAAIRKLEKHYGVTITVA